MKRFVKLFEEFVNDGLEINPKGRLVNSIDGDNSYPKLYSDTHNPTYFYVKSPEEGYFISFNPVTKPDETGDWPITSINKVEGIENIELSIEQVLNPPQDEEDPFDPMVIITTPDEVKHIGDKIEKWKHKFIK